MEEVLIAVAVAAVVWRLIVGRQAAAGAPASDGGAGDGGGGYDDTGLPYGTSDDAGSGSLTLDSIAQAVAHFESGGRQYDGDGNVIRSSAGALGIMQLMPATAAQLGVDPNDPDQNYQGGVSYLKQLFQKYGNWFDALAAYNWGPGNVDRAIAQGAPYPQSVEDYANEVQGYAGGS